MYQRSRETVLNCWWFLGSALLFLRNETKQSSGGCSLPPLPWEPLHKQRLRKLSERPAVEVLALRCAARHQLLVEFTESCDCCCVLNKHGDRRRWSLDLGQSVKRIWRFSQTDWFLQLCHDFPFSFSSLVYFGQRQFSCISEHENIPQSYYCIWREIEFISDLTLNHLMISF